MPCGNRENELWQQCIKWIKSTGVLSPDAEFDKLSDFAFILRNGVLLCHLAIKLSPNCIYSHEILSQYQQSHFVCSKNIALFLKACRDHFSINEVFSEDDLLELQNFPAVLRLLSQLSRSQKSRQLGLKPFPEETILPSKLPMREESDDIYLNLREQYEQQQNTEFDNYSLINKQREEEEERTGQEIYESICSQKIPRNRSLPICYLEFVPTNNRDHCLKELLDTEISYLEGIQTIIDRFYNPLRFHLQSADFATIFINIYDILGLHRKFLPELTQGVLKLLGLVNKEENFLNKNLVAETFFKYKMNFTIYGLYCSQLGSSSRRIEELERIDSNYKRIVEELGTNLQFKLRDFLILPFQRITKYHLILENLVKNTLDLTDKSFLNEAYEAMKDVAVYVNEMKRDQEIIGCINTIERSISDLNVNLLHYGRFMFDGTLKITITENGNSLKAKQRSVFLFESMILFAKREAGTYKSKNFFFLSDFDLVENSELTTSINKYNSISRKLTSNLFDLNNYSNSFMIEKRKKRNSFFGINDGNVVNLIIQFTFKNVNDMNNWKDMIKKAIEISNPKEAAALGHSLLYKTYTSVTICTLCQKLLRGKFFQGYHCSGCNKDFHLECTKKCECNAKIIKQQEVSPIYGIRGDNNTINSISRLSSIFPQTFNLNNNNYNSNINHQLQNINNTILSLNFANGHGGRTLPNNFDFKKRYSRSSNCSLSEVITVDDNDASILPSPMSSSVYKKVPMIVSSRIMETVDIPLERQNIPNEYPWYFGEIGRKVANNLLEGTEGGTFLVRWNPNYQQYVLSLQIGNELKHIKIQLDEEANKYFLHEERLFDSVVDLVNYYRNNSIKEGFEIDVILKSTPLKSAIFVAQRSFSRPDTSKYLSLTPGDIIQVLDTIGEDKGWWKGSINGGPCAYFPFSYVKPEPTELEGTHLEGQRIQQQRQVLFSHQRSSNRSQEQQIPLNFEEELEERLNCEE